MRTFFILNSNETLFDYIELEMEWDNQFLPRVNANGYYITFYMQETDNTLKRCPL